MITIKEIKNNLGITKMLSLTGLLCEEYYNQHYLQLDNLFTNLYGDYTVYGYNGNDWNDAHITLYDNMTSHMIANKYKYDGLFKSMSFDYNPIENYSMTEHTEVIFSGSQTNETSYTGSESNEMTRTGRELNEKTNSGSEKATQKITGSEKETVNIGSQSVTVENQISADDSSTYQPNEQNVTNNGQHSDTSTKEYTNRVNENELTFNNRKDSNLLTFEDRKDTNSKSFDNRKDTNVTSYDNRKDVTEHSRSGNVGVTTSQQMLESERQVVDFMFWHELFNDIAEELLMYVDDRK